MSYRERENSSGAAAAIIVGLLLVGLLVVGGGGAIVFFWARSAQREAMMQRDRAIAAEEQARAQAIADAAEAEAAAAADQQDSNLLGRMLADGAVVVALDEQGQLQADGRALQAADLPDWLARQRDDAIILGTKFSVRIRVHPRCEFKHVITVQEACTKAEVPFQLESAPEPAPEPASEPTSD